MHAIASVPLEREAIDGEVADVAEMNRKGATLPHGDVPHCYVPDVVQQNDTVGGGHGLELGGVATQVAVRFSAGGCQCRPDAAFDGDVGVRLRVRWYGLIGKAEDVFVANHAGVAAGFEPDLRFRICGEFLARLQHERTV